MASPNTTVTNKGKKLSTQTKKGNLKSKKAPSMEECIAACIDCFQSCTRLIPHCLEMGDKHASPSHITLLTSCALLCETSAKLMMLQSEFHMETCRICAEVCLECADDCDSLDPEDQMMADCAEICRRCAERCSSMAASH